MSQIEKSVTHLLIATKQLLETLTQWSRHNATEGEVSDVYVRLGYEFNIACRAFTSIGVDTTDLGPVPDSLRMILEETLSQDASPASLDKFLPRIRDIIINLLHGLKRKQQRLRARQAKENSLGPGQSSRQMSVESVASADTGLTQMLEEVPQQYKVAGRPSERRAGSGSTTHSDDVGIPARTSSVQNPQPSTVKDEPPPRVEGSPSRRDPRDRRQPPPSSLSDSSLSSETMQNLPILSPEEYKLPIQRMSNIDDTSPPRPPPPPKQQDALAALQRGGNLERRASRRYSAYQISKHLGASPGGVPMIPHPQNSPIPNRGRDVRESLNAVRTRGPALPHRSRSTRFNEGASPTRGTTVTRRISEEVGGQQEAQSKPHAELQEPTSPISKTPEDKLGPSFVDSRGEERPALSATLNGPPTDTFDDDGGRIAESAVPTVGARSTQRPEVDAVTRPDSDGQDQFTPEQSPQPGKELTLFLQYKSKIKKFVLPEGSTDLSMARLQLAFIEKFAWNTHNNGVDLPEIYIQDPISGVRHELEDLSDVKDRSVLVLNVEVLDVVKKHIDEGIGGLRKIVEGVRTAVDGQQLVISKISERQQDAAATEMARLASSPHPAAPRTGSGQVNGTKTIVSSSESVEEVQSLRRDLAVMRQTFTNFTSDITSSMASIRSTAQAVKAKAVDATIPVLDGDTGRAYVNGGKKTVGDESESLVNRVDDLQDLVEDLRKDVVTRGVRPLPRQLEQVTKDISLATKELKKMQGYVRREKPVWTKIWEKELETVCNDREFLTMQEELMADLEDDLEKATQTFALVEQATKQQNLQSGQAGGGSGHPVALRSTSRGLAVSLGTTGDVDPVKAKDGVLGEVRALQPNHETRLEAIERAERARRRELESRREGAAFKRELGAFVEEGKLKKSGGVEEAERLRKAKDERNRREEWESQAARKEARAKAREKEKEKMVRAQERAAAGEELNGEDEEGEEGAVEGGMEDAADERREEVAEQTEADGKTEGGAEQGERQEHEQRQEHLARREDAKPEPGESFQVEHHGRQRG